MRKINKAVKSNFFWRFSFKRVLKARSITHLILITAILYLCYIFGLFTHILEKNLIEFDRSFRLDIKIAIEKLNQDSNTEKYVDINNLSFTFLHKAENVCKPVKVNLINKYYLSQPFLVILVKSKYSNFKQRETIRNSWGKSDHNKLIRTVFLVGYPNDLEQETTTSNKNHYSDDDYKVDFEYEKSLLDSNKRNMIIKLELENEKYGDLVQQNFVDTYYNNTLKTLMGIKWTNKYCTNSKYYLFIDDDFYLNPNLLMKYLKTNITDSMIDKLYAGYVFRNSSPMRHMLSKWYISLKDYPYNKFPPYVSAGWYILSKQSARLFYVASKLIKLFKFDDIYMGILASKLDIDPIHIENVYYYAPTYYPSEFARSVMASHGYEANEISKIWNELQDFIKFNSSTSFLF